MNKLVDFSMVLGLDSDATVEWPAIIYHHVDEMMVRLMILSMWDKKWIERRRRENEENDSFGLQERKGFRDLKKFFVLLRITNQTIGN